MLSLIPCCLRILLLASPAIGQWEIDDRRARPDIIEVCVSSGAVEALVLTDSFISEMAGTLDPSVIGQVPAGRMHRNEMAKLAVDRLQIIDGLQGRPVTAILRKQNPPWVVVGSVERPGNYAYHPNHKTLSASGSTDGSSPSERPNADGRPLVAQSNVNGSSTPVEPPETEQRQTMEQEGSEADAFLRDLSPDLWMEMEAARRKEPPAVDAAHDEAVRAARRQAASLTRDLSSARAELEAVKAQLAQQQDAALRARQAAKAVAEERAQLAAHARANGAALEQELVAARREIDALKKSTKTAGDEREEAFRRELATARQDLDAMRHAAEDASAQARALADRAAEQARALAEQRQRTEGLARDLTMAQREAESSKTEAVLANREKAAAQQAHQAAEMSLAEARRALDEERQKIRLLSLAADAQTGFTEDRKVAEAAAKAASEALALERARAATIARDLETARHERDAAKAEATRVSAALRRTLDHERGAALSLARDLRAARKEIDMLKARGPRRPARIEQAPELRTTDRTRPGAAVRVRAAARSARQLELREFRKSAERKPPRSVRLIKIELPDALLPTQPPVPGLW